MLISPSLLHVKTRSSRNRQEPAVHLRAVGVTEGFNLDGMTAQQVLARLDVPVSQQGAEVIEWQCIRSDHAAMAEAGEWADLLDALAFADQDRTMASGGQRVAPLISEGIRAGLCDAITRKDMAAAGAELVRLEAVFELYPDVYAAAHLLAQAHIDIGCCKREVATRGQLSRDLLAESAAHFDAAEELLDLFDPIEEMSPLLAGTRYLLVRGIEDGAALCRDWFEDWCDIDPEDATVHATHAVHMLPDWFGSLAIFEKEARRAASITEHLTGKAAYAIFHLTARDRLGDMLPSLDLLLFLQALTDYQNATGCQHRANIAASVLSEMVRDYKKAGPTSAYQVTKARAALSDVLWNRLHEVHLESWAHGADSLAFALGEIFGPALKRGARIIPKGEGLGTRVPRG
ncbi:hypothetical protein [Tabrizicola sp.]|uniref:hypothetical protein n=1 Tax=Tabrizicola sp. TaxID=2005166 RepID=UPI00262EFE80|nr:hypothetical protein [Tabrizicola sp.]MDM7930475.1 hypothetical protein [Tabrizicola sp.]